MSNSLAMTLAIAPSALMTNVALDRTQEPSPHPERRGHGAIGIGEQRVLQLLHLAPTATAEDIQAAYRRLALAVHPDRGGNAGRAALRRGLNLGPMKPGKRADVEPNSSTGAEIIQPWSHRPYQPARVAKSSRRSRDHPRRPHGRVHPCPPSNS